MTTQITQWNQSSQEKQNIPNQGENPKIPYRSVIENKHGLVSTTVV